MSKTQNPQQPQTLPDPTEPKFSMAKVAKLLDVHVSTISRLMNASKLGYYQIGRRRVVGEKHLQIYLSLTQRQAKATSIH